ncbi:MAG: MBL fold metallo-hydrolase [Pseudomonadota bacterium]
MIRALIACVSFIGIVGALGYYTVMHTGAGQDLLLSRAISAMASTSSGQQQDAMRLFVCGSAAPLPTEGRAQACLAVVTPDHYFVVDAGSGSANNLGIAGLPGQRLDGILLTHYHSDHITDIPTMNVISWVAGRKGALKVYGPPGIEQVVAGFNLAYAQDRHYRTAHHGESFMPIRFGELEPVLLDVESSLEFGEMTVTSFPVDHSPIHPAVGYRFDYKGRSIVITGDTIVTDRLRQVVDDADLLLADALSLPIIQAMESSLSQSRMTKVLGDIQDYHASVADVAELTRSTGVNMTALYHMVPGPRNELMENMFKRELEDNMLLTRDRMWFTLAVGSDEIVVH